MDTKTIKAFKFEMEKIAEFAMIEKAKKSLSHENIESFKKKLKAGDILIANSHPKDKSNRKVYKPLSRLVQGTEYDHSAMYTGDGNIIDIRLGSPFRERPLESLVKRNPVVAVRPKATKEEMKSAVEYAKQQIGKLYPVLDMIRAATPFRGKRKGEEKEKLDSLMCSAMIANAYANKKFSNKSRRFVRPSDIIQSQDVEPIAAYGK